MNESTTPLVSVRNVSFSYGYESVLKDVSLDIYVKDYLAIIGPNGGGKTTLLKIILGLLKPDSGEIIWAGSASTHQIGYVPQFAGFEREFPLSVREVVLMGRMNGRLWQRATSQDKDLTAEMLRKMGLNLLAGKAVSQLSGGQLQRVLIARALVSSPDILFMDEPIASIDSNSRFTLSSMLTDLNQNIPIVIVTHDITSFASNVQHIACVNRTLFYHGQAELANEFLEEAYGCPIELVAHGIPHRVLQDHPVHGEAPCTHDGTRK